LSIKYRKLRAILFRHSFIDSRIDHTRVTVLFVTIFCLFLNYSDRQRYLYIHHGTNSTGELKQPFRHNFTIYKGSTYVVLSRAFVNFIFNEQLAKDFLNWLKDTKVADEVYYSTLYQNTEFDKGKYAQGIFNGGTEMWLLYYRVVKQSIFN
jgi:hypothetical protein